MAMLTYSFANLQGESMYTHLYRCIKQDIMEGTLQADEKLPSKRMLAKHLDISLITVENAYAQLLVEGYIYSQPKRGYYVASLQQQSTSGYLRNRDKLQNTAGQNNPMGQASDAVQAEAHFSGNAAQGSSEQSKFSNMGPCPSISKINKAATPEYFADFTRSTIPEDSFPYNTWAKLLRHTLTTANEHELVGDTSAGGVLRLRRALAQHLYEFRGMNVSPDQIIVGAGTQVLYNLIVQLLGRQHVYALEDPGYPQLAKVYKHNDVFCRYLPMDEKGIRPDVLEASNADILHITPSHQFPTGMIMPISRRYDLLNWAYQKSNRYIIEDDYDCEFRLFGKPIPPLQSIDQGEKVIYINTFSKTLAPTFRISYMLLPPHLAELFYNKLGFYSCTVSNFEQFTLAQFIEERHLERHINRMRTYYRSKRDALLDYIAKSPVADALRVEGADRGLHFLLHLDTEVSDGELIAAAREQGLNIRFLSSYYHAPLNQLSHTMLMNYTGIPEERLWEGLDKLFNIIKKYRKCV